MTVGRLHLSPRLSRLGECSACGGDVYAPFHVTPRHGITFNDGAQAWCNDCGIKGSVHVDAGEAYFAESENGAAK